MKTLSEQQKKSLVALWRALPQHICDQLLASSAGQGALGDILSEIHEIAGLESEPVDDGLFDRFRVFRDLTGTVGQPPTHARFSEDGLRAVERVCALDLKAWKAAGGDEAARQAWRENAAQQIVSRIDAAQGDKDVKSGLSEAFGPGFAEELADVVCLLRHDAVLTQELSHLPEAIANLTQEQVAEIRDAYERICAGAPDASLWLLKIITARLEKTAQIFRIVEKIGKRSDDALVSKTDLADVGDLVLATAEFHAARFLKPPSDLNEADAAGHALAKYVEVTIGMTREFGIRKDGRWGKTLFAIRAKASGSLETFFKQVEKSFSRALPHPAKGQHGLAKPGTMPEKPKIEQAEADLRFLAMAGDWASQAAVGSAQKHAADFVRGELDECARALLEILRTAEDIESDKASEALALIVRYMRAFKDEENAELIQRRAVAVRANAA